MSSTVVLPSLTLSPAEVAWELNFSIDTIYKLIKSGDLPASKVLGRLLISRDALEEFLLKNRVPTSSTRRVKKSPTPTEASRSIN